jgi:hypothetical protein
MLGSDYLYRGILISNPVMTYRGRWSGWNSTRVGGRGLFQTQRLPADCHRIWSKSPVEELVLLILDDEQATATGVFE